MQITNDDMLLALRDAQESQRRRGPGSFAEWRQENINKGHGGLGQSIAHLNPGLGMMGRLNTNSRAPYGPPNRPSGNNAVGLKQFPQQFGVPSGIDGQQGQSKYDYERLNQPPPWIDDVDMASVWYSPMEPVWPFGPPYYNVPREWDYPVGYNLNYVPQRLNLVGTLRGMRQSWGILATVIETRKSQLMRVPWTIQVKGKPRATSKGVELAKKFFKSPDGVLTYRQWAWKYLDDLFVIDAPTLYMDRDNGGRLRHAPVLDGGTIFPLIDDAGRRPDTDAIVTPNGIFYERRQPAFQQIIYGLPMINLSKDEIIYGMMAPRAELPIFGYSPVEQILTEATEAIRKTFYQLEFWRAGSMPELIITVPDNWTPRQIATFQAHFDAVLSGQLTLKSKVRFVPGGMKPFDIKNASGESLWSQRDELLVRLCCYAFSVSPTPFIHQNNRATANQNQEASEEEGLYPLMSYWKDDVVDVILQDKLGLDDVEAVFLPRQEPDQSKQAEIHQIRLHDGSVTINEVRGEMGLEPIPDGDVHLIYTGASVLRLDQVVAGTALQPGQPAPTEGSDVKNQPKPQAPTARSLSPIRGPTQSSTTPSAKPSNFNKSLNRKKLKEAEKQTETDPTKSQMVNGNYAKGKVNFHGMVLTIENPKGSYRKLKDRFGLDQDIKMPAAYGYINGTIGADDMQVDCYIGKHLKSPLVFVIDQDKFDADGKDKGFDEHKVMFGYETSEKAIKAYLKSHYDGMGHERLSAITQLNFDEFRRWLKKGDLQKPISEQGYGNVIGRRGVGNGLTKMDTISQSANLLSYSQSLAFPKKKKKKKNKNSQQGARWLALAEQVGELS